MGKLLRICARKLWFLCTALHNFSTIMHIKFEDVQAIDGKVIFQTSRKCCKNFNQKEITHKHYAVQCLFFHTALCIIATNTNAKFQVNQMTKLCSRLRTILKNFLIQGQITPVVPV